MYGIHDNISHRKIFSAQRDRAKSLLWGRLKSPGRLYLEQQSTYGKVVRAETNWLQWTRTAESKNVKSPKSGEIFKVGLGEYI